MKKLLLSLALGLLASASTAFAGQADPPGLVVAKANFKETAGKNAIVNAATATAVADKLCSRCPHSHHDGSGGQVASASSGGVMGEDGLGTAQSPGIASHHDGSGGQVVSSSSGSYALATELTPAADLTATLSPDRGVAWTETVPALADLTRRPPTTS